MTGNIPQNPAPVPSSKKEFDFTLEAVILLVLGIFMFIFGILLLFIHTGALPYSPDSTYGLFLVLVALQVITMGKTPFGEVRRTWLVIVVGICAGIFGMTACFIPGALSGVIHDLVGVLLLVGGIALLLQLVLNKEKAALWIRIPGILRHLTVACGLVYLLTVLLGLVTLLPGLVHDSVTSFFLILSAISLFYLAWSIQKASALYSPQAKTPAAPLPQGSGDVPFFLRDAPLSFTIALLLFLGVLLSLLAVLLVPVNLGIIPFSPDGQLGLLIVIMAIQFLAMGETPVGQFRRTWLILLSGLLFVTLGAIASIVPGVLTPVLVVLLAVLNILGGIVPLMLRFLPMLQAMGKPPARPAVIPPQLKKLLITQTVLNIVGILFGLSMLLPGFIPGLVVAVILFVNGLLLFLLAGILSALPAPE
ncbi:hypothetical protein [Methanoregula formicica]|uniref:Uncharacterized protein n=1 Tax=Methanoregula formicica (strain DSM 22288 / NBRC 105244 / SMSP) TaxID=593750 RepID=L0HGC8_METFS|nr:hypothetical protein [Methanoregula formicica]AGB02841.1 hypothetical protein Metfor_1818 [Methanoregula formicica SMSP]